MSDHDFRDFSYYAILINNDHHQQQQSVGETDRYRVLSSSSADHDHHHHHHHHPSYMNFTDCLHSTSMEDYDDHGSLEKAFGFSPSYSEVFSSLEGACNLTTNPNSLISCSSSEAGFEEDSDKIKKDKQPKGSSEDGGESSNKGNKTKKKGDKKEKEPRFAFITKSEVDNLEDGYRWRKYGQKAVKNSPFPRSYYRCTTQKCRVKKRLERSFQDPSMVITTYEGQHNHPLPTMLRGAVTSGLFPPSFTLLPPLAAAGPSFPHELFMQMPHHYHLNNPFQQYQNQQQHQVPDYGLLQDMVPSRLLNHQL